MLPECASSSPISPAAVTPPRNCNLSGRIGLCHLSLIQADQSSKDSSRAAADRAGGIGIFEQSTIEADEAANISPACHCTCGERLRDRTAAIFCGQTTGFARSRDTSRCVGIKDRSSANTNQTACRPARYFTCRIGSRDHAACVPNKWRNKCLCGVARDTSFQETDVRMVPDSSVNNPNNAANYFYW